MVRVNVGPRVFANFRLDGNDNAVTGVLMGDATNIRGCQVANVKVERCSTYGINANSGGVPGTVVGCEVTDMKSGATAGIGMGICVACYVHDSPGVGFEYPVLALGCVADTMGSDGFRFGALTQATAIINCVSYGNTGDGFEAADTYKAFAPVLNNIAYGNGGYGFRTDLTEQVARNWLIDHNAFGNNTSGARQNFIAGAHDVTLTADPFTDAANGDFSLNSTSGGGAALKGMGFPATFPVT
jgi:hypothetical protein